jgi:8-oxo-dGTP pyrophosphatase MutT (NUDIX family)
VQHCALNASSAPWDYAAHHAAQIETHWHQRHRENPAFFNGVIHVMDAGTVANGWFQASFKRTDFKSFLYWREDGYPEAGAYDAFGSALILSREGHVLLGRQRAGNINAGLDYLPSGFIDQRDVAADGTIDIAASIRRELAEETGLTQAEIVEQPGFLIVRVGPLVSMVRTFQSKLGSADLRQQILTRLARDVEPELADIVVITSRADIQGANVPPYSALAIQAVIA